jgi:two-component system cell cycle response regulator
MPNRILIVDDNASMRADMSRILKASDPLLEILEASDGVEALKVLGEADVDLIIADLIMPRMDGLKLLTAVRQEERLQHTPLIIVTSRANIEEKLLSFDQGAQDFLTKPYHPAELVARSRVMLRLRAQMRAIEERAIVDALTGLYNHMYLAGALNRELKRCQRYKLDLSCLMIDVDDFKRINDTHGHLAGDEVLRTVGRMLQTTLRGYDFAVRYGGDEFVIVLAQNNPAGARHVAERIREMVMHYMFFPLQAMPNPVTVSIGVASVPGERIKAVTSLIEAADQALYQAKTQGKNRVVTTDSLP